MITQNKKTEQIPPHNTEAEEGLLGCVLINGDLVNEITLLPKDFYHEHTAAIWQACLSLKEKGVKIDQITLAYELESIKKLDTVKGASYLSYLIANCPSSYEYRGYADIVSNLSTARQIINAGYLISKLGYDTTDTSDALNKADALLLEVRKRGAPQIILSPDDAVKIASERYDKLFNRHEGVAITTGLKDLDHFIGGGLYNGDMTLVAGRPGMGKTSFLQGIARHAGLNHKVLFCSAEMPVESILDREVAGILGVPINRIRLGGYDNEPDLYNRITGLALDTIKQTQVYYYSETPITTAKILQASLGMKLRLGLDLIVIDYLGILDDDYGSSGYERVGYISRKTKQIARMLDIPVLAAHQLNREVEKNADKRPQLKDLRDSGKLEEDADVVLMLYRDSYYEQKAQIGKTEIIIAKQRQGVANKYVDVYYDDKHHCYRDLRQED